MEASLKKENICINRLVCQKKELIFIENSMIVPDAKPDILNTINVTGNISISKKEILDDKVKIEGSINTYIMYLPDSKEDNLRALNSIIDFSESIQLKGCKQGMSIVIKPTIKDIECKPVNGRKVSTKVGIEFEIKVYSNDEVEIINEIQEIQDIQTLQQTFCMNSKVAEGFTTIYAKDTLNIDSKDEIAEILKVDINLLDQDIKLSYNKVLTKADIEIKIMYLNENNTIGRVVGKVPVVGFIDMQNLSEDNICENAFEIKNMLFRPNPAEDHSIYVELEIEATCIAFEKKKINIIQDLYSPISNLEFTQNKISWRSEVQEKSKEITVKENLNISGLEEGNLLDVDIKPIILNTQISESKIIYTGNLNLNFIYTKERNINSRNVQIPLEISVENPEEIDKIDVQTEIKIENSMFNIKSSGEVGCNIEIKVITKTAKNICMNIIDNVEIINEIKQGDEDYDSLILYIVQAGDTLWKIAKRFSSTIEEITRMNALDNQDKINIGQKLYIPKFNYQRNEKSINARESIDM